MILGVVLLLLETVLPGWVAGIIGFLCLIAAVGLGYRDFGLQTGNIMLGFVVLGLAAGLICWLKYFPESSVGKRFISKTVVGELNVARPDLINSVGVAITQLRPSGTACISGRRVDVVTEGALIEKGANIRIVAVEGIRIVVREV